jgi:3-methyladenine DNA glycosylase Tag
MPRSRPASEIVRCPWAKGEQYVQYHDFEWGVPVHDDRLLFEFLVLEGAQAGLSWATILKKRDNYRIAFDGFDPKIVARYGSQKRESLLADAGIIRKSSSNNSPVTDRDGVACLSLQRNGHVGDFCSSKFFGVSITVGFHVNAYRDGGLSHPNQPSPKTHQIAHENRPMELHTLHGDGDELLSG